MRRFKLSGSVRMHVVEAGDNQRAEWDRFVFDSPTGSFLQSWAWGDFQRAAGFPITRLVVRNAPLGTHNAELVAACLLVQRPLPLKRFFLSAPWGPVLRDPSVAVPGAPEDSAEVFAVLTAGLRERLRRGAFFARLEPKLPADARTAAALVAHGYVQPGRSIQPKDTLVVDLTGTEDDLLRGMSPKTRYNIRLARRHNVAVESRPDAEGLQVFLRLACEVERRGEFHYHTERYYAAMLRTLAPARTASQSGAGGPIGMLDILIARHQGVPLAAHILLRFSNTVTYAHGASSAQKKSVMAPHLLQWEGMLRAKAQGASRYDLFGVAPPRAPVTHPWTGVTRFKRGFGGTEEHFIGAADCVGDYALYRAYEVGRSLRALLR